MVDEPICTECGDDLATEGYPLCSDCLDASEKDDPLSPAPEA